METELRQQEEKTATVSPTPIVEVKELIVHYETQEGVVEAVNNVSFSIQKGETLGLVGETGAGKTTIALAMIGLLPVPPSHIIQGQVLMEGEDLLTKSEKEMRKVRGKKISMIFQDPMSALNPVHTVGDQIAEVVRLHRRCSKGEATARAMEMLRLVGIPENRYKDYPHQFSGGMKQRVVIAIALACEPELISADEPTTALDVTIQSQVLGTVRQIFRNPMHPYTRGLFESLPDLDHDVERLKPIGGLMANPMDLPPWCSFHDRCDLCSEQCRQQDPVLTEVEPGHFVKCLKFGPGKECGYETA